MNRPKKSIEILVSGMIQGVGFRWSTKQLAERLNIAGSVQNLINGQVKIIAQGNDENVKEFVNEIKKSPTPAGKVTDTRISSVSSLNTSNFIIK